MSNLVTLRDKILSIPDKRKRQDLVGTLRQYNEQAQKSSGLVRKVVAGRECAVEVFPDEQFTEPYEKLKQAARSSVSLLRRIEKNPDTIEKRKFDKVLADINDFAQLSNNTLKAQWKKLISERTHAFTAIVKAAKEANLKGSTKLQELLSSIEARINEPPISKELAVSIRSSLEELVRGVAVLGLEGSVGYFLIEATKGNADPRSLYDQEIRSFIERFDLWKLLRVKLQ